MPEQNYPPPPDDAGALTIPRQLNKWLDKNPQGGQLKRVRKYFSMPTFEIADRWDGYSDIVTAFNFSATKNFSLKLDFEIPEDPNYVLCISYRVGNLVTRYLVWDAEGSNLNQNLAVYSGQPILKNFRLEVWNTSQGISSSSDTIRFDTSILGPYDYMYQQDMVLVAPDAQVLDFWDDSYGGNNIIPPDSVYNADLGSISFRLSITPGFTYNYVSGPASIRVVKSNDNQVFTTVAQAGDPNFIYDTFQPLFYLLLWDPPPPNIGDLITAVVIDTVNINPFAVPLTFPDNAVSVAN